MRGIINVLIELEMLPKFLKQKKSKSSILINEIENIYSPGSGICNVFVKLGSFVKENDKLFEIRDPFGTKQSYNTLSKSNGIIISIKAAPLVNEGEIIVKLAKYDNTTSIESNFEIMNNE
jgi:predicted deacylase